MIRRMLKPWSISSRVTFLGFPSQWRGSLLKKCFCIKGMLKDAFFIMGGIENDWCSNYKAMAVADRKVELEERR